MDKNSTFELNNGTRIPVIGFGTNVLQGESGIKDIQRALEAEYRLIDTAQSYENEEEVGLAVENSPVPRQDIFITTKITDENQGRELTFESTHASLEKLRTDYVDLLLVHWPNLDDFDISLETWQALISLQEQGIARAIGVSNYTPDLIQLTIDESGVIPAVNQVEFHPFLFQKDLMDYCQSQNILVESYCPIARAEHTQAPILQHLSEKYDKSPVQVILRWHLEHGLVPIPRSTNPDHIEANLDIFDFSLTDEEVAKMDELDMNYRIVNPEKGPPSWRKA